MVVIDHKPDKYFECAAKRQTDYASGVTVDAAAERIL